MVSKFLTGTAAAALLTAGLVAPAAAQAPRPAPVPVFTWTGFYAGGSFGYLEQDRKAGAVGTAAFGNPALGGGPEAAQVLARQSTGAVASPQGGTAGGQIGYNMRFGAAVIGVEADAQTMVFGSRQRTNNSSAPFPGFPPFTIDTFQRSEARYDYFGTVRGRIGYLVQENLLVYGTGGFAFAGLHTDVTQRSVIGPTPTGTIPGNLLVNGSVRQNSTPTGYVVGGGLEYALDASWSVKGEALYYDLGKSRGAGSFNSFGQTVTPGDTLFTTTRINTRQDNTGYLARLGLNYKFNWF